VGGRVCHTHEHDVCDCAPTGRRGLHQAGLPWGHHHRQRLIIHVPALDEGLSTLANTNVDDGPIYAPGEPYGAPQPGAKESSPIPLSWTGTEHVGQRTLHGSVQCAPPSQRRYGHVPWPAALWARPRLSWSMGCPRRQRTTDSSLRAINRSPTTPGALYPTTLPR
jgi:hypothetical protein